MKYVKSIIIWGMNKSLELNFWSVLSYRLLMFANAESLSKTKHNLTLRMGQKIKLQSLVQIFTKYRWILRMKKF